MTGPSDASDPTANDPKRPWSPSENTAHRPIRCPCKHPTEDHHIQPMGEPLACSTCEKAPPNSPFVVLPHSEESGLLAIAAVLGEYRDKPHYVDLAIAAMIQEALDWPRLDGSRPSDILRHRGDNDPGTRHG